MRCLDTSKSYRSLHNVLARRVTGLAVDALSAHCPVGLSVLRSSIVKSIPTGARGVQPAIPVVVRGVRVVSARAVGTAFVRTLCKRVPLLRARRAGTRAIVPLSRRRLLFVFQFARRNDAKIRVGCDFERAPVSVWVEANRTTAFETIKPPRRAHLEMRGRAECTASDPSGGTGWAIGTGATCDKKAMLRRTPCTCAKWLGVYASSRAKGGIRTVGVIGPCHGRL